MSNLVVRFIEKSKNRKTGPIPVSSSPMSTCSPTCPFNVGDDGRVLSENGEVPKCYGGFGNTRIHWTNLSNAKQSGNVTDWNGFMSRVEALPDGQLWRHDEVGDLPHKNGKISAVKAYRLMGANRGKRGFTYTHHKIEGKSLLNNNRMIVETMNENGFTVNHSANSPEEAAKAFKEFKKKIPVVTVLPSDAPNVQTVDDVKVVACPAEKSDVTCATCGLCQHSDRDYIIGFRAHGTGKKHANVIARG